MLQYPIFDTMINGSRRDADSLNYVGLTGTVAAYEHIYTAKVEFRFTDCFEPLYRYSLNQRARTSDRCHL